MLVASAAVPTTRVGNAAHGILREHSGDCTETEESGERECERELHDVGLRGSVENTSANAFQLFCSWQTTLGISHCSCAAVGGKAMFRGHRGVGHVSYPKLG